MQDKKCCILANFGGPRDLDEIFSFLEELLTDKELIRTRLPGYVQDLLFRRVAKKRSEKIRHDYAMIGGGSPIYRDTQMLANALSAQLDMPVIPFHRYLPATHREFLEHVMRSDAETFLLFPMFPQFSYATTGSIAKWFATHLPVRLTRRFRWIVSYAAHPLFLLSWREVIEEYAREYGIDLANSFLLFSAHGLPQKFVDEGDIYESQCRRCVNELMKAFPTTPFRLGFQSKFGKGEWLRPYTEELCEGVLSWIENKENVLFIPISFTSDHIETLFEIEKLYLPIVIRQGVRAYRCPALGLGDRWIHRIPEIIQTSDYVGNAMLVRA